MCYRIGSRLLRIFAHRATKISESIAYLSFRKSECNSMATSLPFFFSPILRDILISRRRISESLFAKYVPKMCKSILFVYFRFHLSFFPISLQLKLCVFVYLLSRHRFSHTFNNRRLIMYLLDPNTLRFLRG